LLQHHVPKKLANIGSNGRIVGIIKVELYLPVRVSCVELVSIAGNLACRDGWLGVDWPSDGDPMVREWFSDVDGVVAFVVLLGCSVW
jgi:hypothetical protein